MPTKKTKLRGAAASAPKKGSPAAKAWAAKMQAARAKKNGKKPAAKPKTKTAKPLPKPKVKPVKASKPKKQVIALAVSSKKQAKRIAKYNLKKPTGKKTKK